jgi:glycosyltransferase involved in cell wall biosynthesis
MKKPFVSVIVPTRNRAHFIENVLRNFARQTYPSSRMELIIHDDSDIPINKLLIPDKLNIKYIYHDPHTDDGPRAMPLGKKRNELCKLASGEIIFQMDDDDLYPKGSVSHIVSKLSLKGKFVACADSIYFFDLEKQTVGFFKLKNPTHIVGFKKSILERTSFDDSAWITEEAAFLKGCFKKEVAVLDPRKSLLMTCHTSNTSAKDSYLSVETATNLNLEDFVSDEKDIGFFTERLPNILGLYKPVNFMSLMAEARRKEMEREY